MEGTAPVNSKNPSTRLTAYRDHRAMASSISVTESKCYLRILGVWGYDSYSLLRPGWQIMTPGAGGRTLLGDLEGHLSRAAERNIEGGYELSQGKKVKIIAKQKRKDQHEVEGETDVCYSVAKTSTGQECCLPSAGRMQG